MNGGREAEDGAVTGPSFQGGCDTPNSPTDNTALSRPPATL